ncbi:50S ribosomal protein 6, chloroplastic [Vitis vinifera]|uniref:50S ribosomal protein 6, chloroplastic n=1 Tax=Vitis vinifera TaxID=29760 RepID=A0A438K0L3_VITVI|nr:50S ribosomal protein 6, chloroplastic [Vitis vinifera]
MSHHKKTRPCKTQPWDIKRRPTVYAQLAPLAHEWTVVSFYADASDAAVPSPTPQPATE